MSFTAIVTRRHIRGEVEDVIEIPAQVLACPLGIVAFDKFCEDIGRSQDTVHAWVKKGWLAVVDITGRNYITQKSLLSFIEHAENGDYAAPSNIERKRNGS